MLRDEETMGGSNWDGGQALVEDLDGVGAGEEKPVEDADVGEGGVEWGVGCGGDDLDGGNGHGGRAEGFELGGEIGGLVAGSGDEDAFVGQALHGRLACSGYCIDSRMLWCGMRNANRRWCVDWPYRLGRTLTLLDCWPRMARQGERFMPTYISLARWTPQGAHTLKESPARLDAAKKAFAADGVKILNFYLTTGTHDMLIISEAPNDEVMAKAMLTTLAQGGITTQTSRAFTEEEYRKIVGSL